MIIIFKSIEIFSDTSILSKVQNLTTADLN